MAPQGSHYLLASFLYTLYLDYIFGVNMQAVAVVLGHPCIISKYQFICALTVSIVY